MADNRDPAAPTSDEFTWHPEYRGKTVSSVRTSLATEIASDQRAYALTLDGAEEHEGDSLTSIIALERKWGPYDLNWAETEPEALADRIVAFELERDRRQQMIPYSEYRESMRPDDGTDDVDAAGAQRLESPLARGLVVLVLLLILVVLWWIVFR